MLQVWRPSIVLAALDVLCCVAAGFRVTQSATIEGAISLLRTTIDHDGIIRGLSAKLWSVRLRIVD